MLIQVPIPDLKKPPTFQFPDRCVNCDRERAEILKLMFNTNEKVRGKPVEIEMKVPMCKACADRERSIAKVTLIPFLIIGFIFGVIAFVPATLISPEGSTPDTAGFPFVFGGFVGLIVGIITGTVGEMIVKTLAVPFYGKLVTRRPLTILSFLSETDDLLGVSAKFLRGKKLMQLEFENEIIAREFAVLNHLETQ